MWADWKNLFITMTSVTHFGLGHLLNAVYLKVVTVDQYQASDTESSGLGICVVLQTKK